MPLPEYSHESLEKLRHQYYNDKLFRTFFPVLSQLEEERQELSPVLIWRMTEILRERLQSTSYPETDVCSFPSLLRSEYECREETILCILFILFCQLADATAEADKRTENPNHAICHALAKILGRDEYKWYIDTLFKRLTSDKKDAFGNEVVLPVTNYMTGQVAEQAMDEQAKATCEQLLSDILYVTANLQSLFEIDTDKQKSIWMKVLADKDLMLLMGETSPRGFEKSINFKLVCNILGIMQKIRNAEGKEILNKNVTLVNNALGDKNYRHYIANSSTFSDSNNCVISKQQYDKIEKIIRLIIE